MRYQSFDELPVWQTSLELTKHIYDATVTGAWSRDYALRDQFDRLGSDIGGLIRYLEKYRQTKTAKRLSR